MLERLLRFAIVLFGVGFALTFTVPAARAAEPATYTISGGLAVGGYDPVAYFTQSAPTQGSPAFTHVWNGATYRFSSAANRDLFKANPTQYAPQFGGYCAYAVSQRKLAAGMPQYWAIVDGKLYLNLNAGVQRTWNRDRAGYIAKARANWPGVLEKQAGLFGF